MEFLVAEMQLSMLWLILDSELSEGTQGNYQKANVDHECMNYVLETCDSDI